MGKLKIHRATFSVALLIMIAGSNACSSIRTTQIKKVVPWVVGSWEGSAYQYDTNENWPILLTVEDVGNSFRVSYPSLACSGKWKLLKATKNRIELREKILTGKQNCVTRGMVVLEEKEDQLLFGYYYPTDTDLNAEGQLRLQN